MLLCTGPSTEGLAYPLRKLACPEDSPRSSVLWTLHISADCSQAPAPELLIQTGWRHYSGLPHIPAWDLHRESFLLKINLSISLV